MPMKPRKPCKGPLCPGLTSTKYCDRHAHLEQQDKARWDARRGSAKERGYGGSWSAARLMHLRNSPLCYDCGRPATLVHHIVPISEGGPRLDMDGLMSLCVGCHGKRHGNDARAKG
ncbi:MAG TPA: HNH endonuclease [Candidatus Deferrimicrobium sp.]